MHSADIGICSFFLSFCTAGCVCVCDESLQWRVDTVCMDNIETYSCITYLPLTKMARGFSMFTKRGGVKLQAVLSGYHI